MKHDETLGQAPPQGTTGAPATNRVDHGGCPSDLQPLIQRMYEEAEQCDVFGITKPAALLREAADALQHAANMQAMDEFAEVVTAGHLSQAEPLTLDQIGALDAGCGHGALHWDTRVSLVRATERAHGIGHPELPLLPPAEPVAWGFPNSAITGGNRWLMLREQVPADDQYGGAMWVPLYAAPKA